MNKYTTDQVRKAAECHRSLASHWASANNVAKFGTDFMWTQKEVDKFLARNRTPGRPVG